MLLQLEEVAQAVSGKLFGANLTVSGVSIDTRTLKAGELYIAIKGKNFDGHGFVDKALEAGAIAVICEQPSDRDIAQIVVTDSHLALAELAGYWRDKLAVKVIGITGSNGKTTVKEMVAAILSTQAHTLFTQGNLNNDIGVPLTLLKLADSHRYAVIEMGANHSGEIAYTSRYAKPDVAIITNISAAHIEGFGSVNAVAQAKGEIIANLNTSGIAVLNCDDDFYPYWQKLAENAGSVSFGFADDADVTALQISSSLQAEGYRTEFILKTTTAMLAMHIHLAGKHNVKNALAAAAACLQLGIPLQAIKDGLATLKPVTGRLQPLHGRKGNIVIDDTYNANPASLKAGLEVLDSKQKNWLILGAFGELGEDSLNIHYQMGQLIRSMPVERVFAVGKHAEETIKAFGHGGQFFDSQDQLISILNETLTGEETLLVKGSRAQKMENIVAALVENFRAA
jgi:UDP-N-acetylmuramoyl-tripeptide--D-alanyl-D-alanine ligase